MVNSEEEFILDFKPGEKLTQMAVFDIEDIQSDCSTISASEASNNAYNSPTPPLLCKLRKVRVMIKKLPLHVLAKHNLKSKKSIRSISRVDRTKVPGHVNKRLKNYVNKKKDFREVASIERQLAREKRGEISKKKFKYSDNFKRSIKMTNSNKHSKSYNKTPKQSAAKSRAVTDPFSAIQHKHISQKIESNRKQVKPSTLQNFSNVTSDRNMILNNGRGLHERIAATNIKGNQNKSVLSTLPNCPDVVITKYDISKNVSSSTSVSNFLMTESEHNSNCNSKVEQNYIQNFITESRSQHGINVQDSLPTTYLNYSSQSVTAFPTSITPASHQTLQPIVVSSSNISNKKAVTVQAFRVPQHFSSENDAVIVTPPKVLIINQPSIRKDPLDMKNSLQQSKNILNHKKLDKEIYTDNSCELDAEMTLSDTERQTESQVIKRIIYHTKSVQTKFTCNSSICGLVDSDGFNLNCFYCYDIFPLDKWFQFKEHIKLVHHVEEKENQSELDEDNKCSNSQSFEELKKNFSKTIKNQNSSLNKENLVTNSTISGEKCSRKLPLEPRLVAERLNRACGSPDSVLATKLTYQERHSKNLRRTPISTKLQLSDTNLKNDVIDLDSDTDLETETVSETNKPATNYLQKIKFTRKANMTYYGVDEISKLIPPTLSHITIKKVEKVLPKQQINSPQPDSRSSDFKKSDRNLRSDLSTDKMINNISKPTTQQLSTNGRIRPRYFVVKKVIKLPTTETIPNLHFSKGMMLTKMSKTEKEICQSSDDDNMPSTDECEDSVPKPTNGNGILFGVTNSMVVIEFLLKLKTFPELWRSQLKNNTSTNYNEGIRNMCTHLNNRFELNITESEMRLSIRRIKKWYCSILKKIHEHNTNSRNVEPYKHKFPLYFKILNQYLTTNVNYSSMNKYPKWVQYKTKTPSAVSNIIRLDDKVTKIAAIKPKINIADHFKAPIPKKSSSTTLIEKNITTSSTPPSKAGENVIEFDADTLYDHGSSDDEVIQTFDATARITKRHYNEKYYGHFECEVCHKTYKRIYDMKRHKILHLPPQFECGICSQKFYFRRWAEKCSHLIKKRQRPRMKNTDGETPQHKRVWPKKVFRFKMICEICGASYRSIGSLNTHKRDKHLNQREKCIVCNFTALSKWRIVQHQKKRHIVEPGTVEEVAKKTRPRTDTKTPFSNEARQEFFWRREMRMKLKPGEIFYGCCKCRIVFNSRREKVLHNKLEHPIKETTVICLLCLPTKLLLSNSNCARRHYTDIHKVPWHEIDALVKRTKPIFNLLSKEEIELLKASENYKELLEELLKNKNLEVPPKVEFVENETIEAVQNLPILSDIKSDEENKIVEECTQEAECVQEEEFTQEENVYVDCIVDHDHSAEDDFNGQENANSIEEQVTTNNYKGNDIVDNQNKNDLYSHHTYDDQIIDVDYSIENSESKMYNRAQNDHEYLEVIVDDFIEGELIEESIIVEECIEEAIGGEEEQYF